MLLDTATRPQDLAVLTAFAESHVAKLLGVQDHKLSKAAVEHYQHYTTGEIVEVRFQNEAVDLAVRSPKGITALEIATGGGKTIIVAKVAKVFLENNKDVIYICPSRTALGSEASGIIQAFHRVFNHYGVRVRLGRVNEPSKVNRINFFTPGGLLGLRKLNRAFFDQLIERASLILLDEAHHFPENDKGELKIFGEVARIARERFADLGKKVVAFTGTYGRLDGKTVIGKTPDYRFSVQDSINEGRCPEIHGAQVYLPFRCPKARRVGKDYDLGLEGDERAEYWRIVAGHMVQFWKKFPGPLAAMVRLVAEAVYLVKIFNRSSGLGERGLAVLTGDVAPAERERIINGIKGGTLVGYVTCGVGVESIDIPCLEVVHIIQRTKSINKIVQFVGRTLRTYPGKRRALIVDYQVMKEGIIRACNGILLYAKGVGIDPDVVRKLANGGAIAAIEGAESAVLPDAQTFGDCEEWVIRGCCKGSKLAYYWESLLRMAASGAPRPSHRSSGEWEGQSCLKLACAFYRLKNSKHMYPILLSQLKAIPGVHQSWIVMREGLREAQKKEVLRRAAAGEPKPRRNNPEDRKLAFCITQAINKKHRCYDAAFKRKLKKLRPEWLEPGLTVEAAPEPRPGPKATVAAKPITHVLEGHWLLTGLYANPESNSKDTVQDVIVKLAQTGIPFPPEFRLNRNGAVTHFRRDPLDPESYFVPEYREASVRNLRLNGHKMKGLGDDDTVKLPVAWTLSFLEDAIGRYTNVNLAQGAGKKYDDAFSCAIRIFKPDWETIRSWLTWRDRFLWASQAPHMRSSVGMSPWEATIKEFEIEFFRNFKEVKPSERERFLRLFLTIDAELGSFLGSLQAGWLEWFAQVVHPDLMKPVIDLCGKLELRRELHGARVEGQSFLTAIIDDLYRKTKDKMTRFYDTKIQNALCHATRALFGQEEAFRRPLIPSDLYGSRFNYIMDLLKDGDQLIRTSLTGRRLDLL